MKIKNSRRSLRMLASLVAMATVALTACSSQGGAQNQPAGPQANVTTPGGKAYTIAIVTHAEQGDAFWDKVQAGANTAAQAFGVTLKYAGDPESGKQATLVQNAIDSKVDGIASTLASPDAVGPTLAKAADAGIPTVAFNAGIDAYQKYGAKMYFGSDEDVAGQAIGTRLSQLGDTGKAICVVHEQGNIALETRCQGVKKTYPNVENLQVNGKDAPSVQQTIDAKLRQDPSIAYLVTLGSPWGDLASQAVAATGSNAKIATFDLDKQTVKDIKDGKILFAVDQQPWLQGFLAVQMLWANLANGNDLGGGKPVLTGPSYVDNTNIDNIIQFANSNTR